MKITNVDLATREDFTTIIDCHNGDTLIIGKTGDDLWQVRVTVDGRTIIS